MCIVGQRTRRYRERRWRAYVKFVINALRLWVTLGPRALWILALLERMSTRLTRLFGVE